MQTEDLVLIISIVSGFMSPERLETYSVILSVLGKKKFPQKVGKAKDWPASYHRPAEKNEIGKMRSEK